VSRTRPGAAGRRCAWPSRSWTRSATCGTPGRSCASARPRPPTSWPRCRRARCCPGLPSHCAQPHRTLQAREPAGWGRAGGLQEGAGEGGGRVRAGRARVPHRLGAAGPHGARPGPHGGRGPPEEVPAAVRGAPGRRPRPARAGHRSLPGGPPTQSANGMRGPSETLCSARRCASASGTATAAARSCSGCRSRSTRACSRPSGSSPCSAACTRAPARPAPAACRTTQLTGAGTGRRGWPRGAQAVCERDHHHPRLGRPAVDGRGRAGRRHDRAGPRVPGAGQQAAQGARMLRVCGPAPTQPPQKPQRPAVRGGGLRAAPRGRRCGSGRRSTTAARPSTTSWSSCRCSSSSRTRRCAPGGPGLHTLLPCAARHWHAS